MPLVLGRMIRWTHCFDTLSWFEELAEAAFAMALKNLGKRGIRRLVVRVWIVKQQRQVMHPLEHDLTEFPGWKVADESRRTEIRAAARKFLLNHSDGYAEIGARTNYSDPGYIAIWLLRDAVRTDSALKTAVTAKWIDALLGQFNNGSAPAMT